MSNLHFHGLHVSPDRPQDDVRTMMSSPGETLNYKVVVPSYLTPGLYWYHTHPHGESARQDLDGMSGAIIVEGIDRYYPELRHMRERVLILRDADVEHTDEAHRKQILEKADVSSSRCGTSAEQAPGRVFTVNGQLRPAIPIDAGERQFWRIVNTSPDQHADLQISSEQLEIVALDGMPGQRIIQQIWAARLPIPETRPAVFLRAPPSLSTSLTGMVERTTRRQTSLRWHGGIDCVRALSDYECIFGADAVS